MPKCQHFAVGHERVSASRRQSGCLHKRQRRVLTSVRGSTPPPRGGGGAVCIISTAQQAKPKVTATETQFGPKRRVYPPGSLKSLFETTLEPSLATERPDQKPKGNGFYGWRCRGFIHKASWFLLLPFQSPLLPFVHNTQGQYQQKKAYG